MRFLLAALMVTLLVACGDNPKNSEEAAQFAQQNEAYDQMMVVHDEVMPKMSDISRTRRALKSHLDNPDLTPAMKKKVMENINGLNDADDGMMDWMRNIEKPRNLRDAKSHDEVMNYYMQQQAEIEKVKRAMETNLVGGQMLVSELKGK